MNYCTLRLDGRVWRSRNLKTIIRFMSTATYTAKDITVLEGLEPVRRRPSMYIGGVDNKGLHHLVWEIIDNAVDEYLNGYADKVTVTLHKGSQAVTVSD